MAKPPRYFRYSFWSLSMHVTANNWSHINHKLETPKCFRKDIHFKKYVYI